MLHLISIMDALESRDMDEVNSKATLLLQIGDAFMNLQLRTWILFTQFILTSKDMEDGTKKKSRS